MLFSTARRSCISCMASGRTSFDVQTSVPMMSMCERMLTNSGAGQTCSTVAQQSCYLLACILYLLHRTLVIIASTQSGSQMMFTCAFEDIATITVFPSFWRWVGRKLLVFIACGGQQALFLL